MQTAHRSKITSSERISSSDNETDTTFTVKRKGKQKTVKRGGKKGKGRIPKEKETEESDGNCGICNLTYLEREDWICCDTCSIWYHRNCVGLEKSSLWEQFTVSNEEYPCPLFHYNRNWISK